MAITGTDATTNLDVEAKIGTQGGETQMRELRVAHENNATLEG